KQLLFNRINLGLISRVSSCHSSHSGPSPHAGWEPTHKPSDTLAGVDPYKKINKRYLDHDERIHIADWRREGVSIREIARRLGRC
ncbi:helix-turn-helix domain-containing protein, partial [Corynebacterium striatum]